MPESLPKLVAQPLAVFERDGLRAALARARLPVDDVAAEQVPFWRFVNADDIPVGFGGLKLHGRDVLLHSLLVLPPLRRQGAGSAMVAMLEIEARVLGAHVVWVATEAAALFFERLGYSAAPVMHAPEPIRGSPQFRSLDPAAATVMQKRLA